MFAINHAATALLLRKKFLTRIPLLLAAVQVPGLLWVALNYAGIERLMVAGGTIDYTRFQYSHSALSILGMGLLAWLVLKGLGRKAICVSVGIGIVTHLVLDLVMRDNIPAAPFIGGPKLGLGLYRFPLLAAAMETGYGVLCWRLYKGSKALLLSILFLNLIDIPLIFHSHIPFLTPIFERHPNAFVTLILLQILASSALVWLFHKRPLAEMGPDEIKQAVSERYGKVATTPRLSYNFPVGRKFAEAVGYPPALLDSLPQGLWESFTGAGNPQEYADVKPGEKLLDLGCGAGLDLYIYSGKVGPTGRVYGLDISGSMTKKAGDNLAAAGISNFDTVQAPSDRVPFPDNTFDIVTANGVYNLSPDKDKAISETYRVLKKGGRTIFAEVMLTGRIDEEVKSLDEWFRCIGGALPLEEFLEKMRSHGFRNPSVLYSGRNIRTGHELSVCAVIRAEK